MPLPCLSEGDVQRSVGGVLLACSFVVLLVFSPPPASHAAAYPAPVRGVRRGDGRGSVTTHALWSVPRVGRTN